MKFPSHLTPYGAFFIRLLVGFHLIYGTQDNVFLYDRMLEFRTFLEERGVIYPLIAAFLSAYAQFICGILYLVGWKVRWAAAIMITNFIVAIGIAHMDDSYPDVFPALVMLFSSVFLLFNGAGMPSIEEGWRMKARE